MSWTYKQLHDLVAVGMTSNSILAAELDFQIFAKSAESADLVVRAEGASNRRSHYCKYRLSIHGRQV